MKLSVSVLTAFGQMDDATMPSVRPVKAVVTSVGYHGVI